MWKVLNRSSSNIHSIAYIWGGMSIFGYLVSFLRDRAFAYHFGASELLDVYIASFRIPDMLFITATAFISVYALLPMFEKKREEGKEGLREFINTTFCFLLLFLLIGGVVLFFLIPVAGKHLFSGFSAESFEIFTRFSRIFLIQASLFAVSSFFIAILQFKRKFLLYSLLPIFYNIGIILGVVVFYPAYGTIGLAAGVLLGVLLHLGLQIPVIVRNDIMPRIAMTKRGARECWRAVRVSVPRASALLSHTIATVFVSGAIVSVSEGMLSVYYFSDNLRALPLAIVGMAYSVATFPVLVDHFVRDTMDKFRKTVENALRRLLFFILPMIAGIFVLREPLISLFFETGSFTAETTEITGMIVSVFILSAFTMSILIIGARALYACGKSLLPFTVFVTLSALEIVLVFATIGFLERNPYILSGIQDITGLPSGEYGILFAIVTVLVTLESVAALAMLAILFRAIRQKFKPIVVAFLQNGIAVIALIASVMPIKVYLFDGMTYGSLRGILAIGCMAVIGGVFWHMTLRLLGNKDQERVKEAALRRIRSLWKT